ARHGHGVALADGARPHSAALSGLRPGCVACPGLPSLGPPPRIGETTPRWSMSQRRRRLLLFGLLAVMAALAVAVWLVWPRSAINRANYERIEQGMTRAEVEAILGGP